MSKAIFRLATRRTMAAVATVSALALVCATTEQRPPIDPPTRSDPVELTAAIAESPTTVGVADSDVMRTGSIEEVNRHLDLLQSIGVQNVRVGISWYATQSSANSDFVWTSTDYVIEEAYRRGMGVLGVLHETPAWAGRPPLAGMPDPAAFGAFAGAVAERYQGKVSALEVWNEPNGRIFLDPLDPAGYTAMLRAAYTAIKAHDDLDDPDDDITVIAGGLGSGRTVPGVSINPVDYLQGMYAAGAHGYFDALAFHPYQRDIPFSQGESERNSPILQLRAIRELMRLNGDGELKVWASEYGLSTAPFNPLLPLQYNSLRKQARFIADFLSNWQNQEGTGPMFIYSTIDLNSASFNSEKNFGLFYSDGTPKPAVKVVIDFLNGADLDLPRRNLFDEVKAILDGTLRFGGAVIRGAVDVLAGVTIGLVTGIASVASWVLGDTWLVNTPRAVLTAVVHLIADGVTGTVNRIGDAISHALGIERPGPGTNRTSTGAAVVESPTAADAMPGSGELDEPGALRHDAAETRVTEAVDRQAVAVEPARTEPETTDTHSLDPESPESELADVDPGGQPAGPAELPADLGAEELEESEGQPAENESETNTSGGVDADDVDADVDADVDGGVDAADVDAGPTPSAATAQGSDAPASIGAH